MTINEIAKMAGVSSAAVSRYFNNGYLSDEKKEAIRRVVEETGYRPSLQAQMLRTKKTKTIGLIIPRVESTTMARVIKGVLGTLNARGYRMILADTQNDIHNEEEYLSIFDETQVDGIIMAGTTFTAAHRKAMKKVTVPLVVIGQQIAGFNCIFHNDYHAEYDLTKTFIQHGKKNFGYIGVTEKDRAVGEQRYKGFCDALKAAGLSDQRNHVAIGDFSLESGYNAMAKLYADYPDMDAVICATDRMALGAAKWCREHGVRIPQQLELAGQGDSELAQLCDPPFSTIHFYYEESGSTAAARVLELIAADEAERNITRELQLGYQIVNRLTANNQ